MRERLLTLGLAAGALLVFYALFFATPTPPSEQPTPPVSTQSGPDGLAAAWRWLALERIPVASLRDRYDQLERAPLSDAATGNILIASMPQRLPMRAGEWAALDRWVDRGNTLLILAALDDTPRWAKGVDADYLSRLLRMTRIRFTAHDAGLRRSLPASVQPVNPVTVLLESRGRHPLLARVHRMQVVSELPASRWLGQPISGVTALALVQRRDDRDPVLWLEPRGAGQIIVCAFAGAFSNRQIGQADNAQLLANIIAWSRTPSGRVIFDDAHQGLVAFYDPQAFFGDPRLHRTLWWILSLWLVWVLGSQTLRSRQVAWCPVDETALIQASGRFYCACVPQREAARRLLLNFFNELHRRLRRTEDGTPPWEWLAAQPGVGRAQYLELRAVHARAAAHAGINLTRLQNLLSQLRGSIG